MNSCNLVVRNMPLDMTDETLGKLFSGSGQVMSATISRDTGAAVGLVVMTQQDARAAIGHLNGHKFNDLALNVALETDGAIDPDSKEDALDKLQSGPR